MGGPTRRRRPADLALLAEPAHLARPPSDLEQHLQQRDRALRGRLRRRVPLRRLDARGCSSTAASATTASPGSSTRSRSGSNATTRSSARSSTATTRGSSWIEDRFYVTWCNGYHGPTIGVGWTTDFETFHQLENAFLPYNRNGVLFPRKIDGRFAMLSRPSDDGHTPFGDIFYSESPDLRFWGKHRHVLSPVPNSWQATKVGGGPAPLETSEGWLLLYHGVLTSLQRLRLQRRRRIARPRRAMACRGARRAVRALAAGPLRARRRRPERGLPVRDALRRAHRATGDLLRRGRHRDRRSHSPTSTSSCGSLRSTRS